MMPTVRRIAATFMLICLTCGAAMGFESMTATIRVSSDSLYDYVVVGQRPQATDGFDNAYDTISPGNLNADMGLPYISAVIVHPEWKKMTRELRGDIRSPEKRQEWQLTVSSSLAKGTPLTIALQEDKTTLPRAMKLTLRDVTKGKAIDLKAESYTIPAPGQGMTTQIDIIAEQP